MGAPEKSVIARVLSTLDPDTERLFRINAGTGWIGRIVKRGPTSMILADPRPLKAGPEGWPDLFGWQTIEITPDMIGQRIAVARGVEVKAGGSERDLRPHQQRFADLLRMMGGQLNIKT